jgi:hypothetical protein
VVVTKGLSVETVGGTEHGGPETRGVTRRARRSLPGWLLAGLAAGLGSTRRVSETGLPGCQLAPGLRHGMTTCGWLAVLPYRRCPTTSSTPDWTDAGPRGSQVSETGAAKRVMQKRGSGA